MPSAPSRYSSVRTRIAPSPTGELHVGSMAMALKNWAYARKHGGSFIVRVEDTDRERLVPGATERMLATLKQYGLDYDEGPVIGGPYGPYTQSERINLYQQKAEELVKAGKAYYCFATKEELEQMRAQAQLEKRPPRYNGLYRDYPLDKAMQRIAQGDPYVIRLRVPEDTTVSFTDVIRGKVSFSSKEISDQILLKSDGFPTYHLAVVVDDYLMSISHIIRGEEWISSTPKHILLYQAFGWELPQYAHIPVFLNPSGKGKMSKRKGTVGAQNFLDMGYLPEALLNFFMILGWAHPEQKEVLSLDEYVKQFDLPDVNKAGVAFDIKKLNWLNAHYIRSLSLDELYQRIQSFVPQTFPQDKLRATLALLQERLERLDQFEEFAEFVTHPKPLDNNMLLKKSNSSDVCRQIEITTHELAKITWSTPEIERVIRHLQESNEWSRSQYFMLLRYATTGKKATPPLFEMLDVIGQVQVIERLKRAKQVLQT